MASVHGSKSYFACGASVNLTTFVNNIAVVRPKDQAETSTMGQTSKTYVAGLKDLTITIAGNFDSVAGGPNVTLAALYATTSSVNYWYGPEGSTAGSIKWSGSALCTKYDVTSPVGGVVAFTADFQGTGDVTEGTF